MRKIVLALAALVFGAVLAGCQSPVTMWSACTNASDGNPTGTDGSYVLICEDGKWTPIMTVAEYAKILAKEPVTIAPLPTEPTTTTTAPATTTTSTTTSTTSTTSTTTTTTTIPAGAVISTTFEGPDDSCQPAESVADGTYIGVCQNSAVGFSVVTVGRFADVAAGCPAGGYFPATGGDITGTVTQGASSVTLESISDTGTAEFFQRVTPFDVNDGDITFVVDTADFAAVPECD